MEKVKIFCVTHNIDGNYFSNYVVGVSKEDVRERYGSSLDIKKIAQCDVIVSLICNINLFQPVPAGQCREKVRRI